MPKIALMQNLTAGYANSNVDKVCRAEVTNMYPEATSSQASAQRILRSISGTSTLLELPEARCRGMYRASRGPNGSPVLYAVFGSHLYLIERSGSRLVYTQIGSVSNSVVTPVSMCETGGYSHASEDETTTFTTDAHPRLMIADGIQLYTVDTTLPSGLQVESYQAVRLPLRPGSTTEYIHPSHVTYAYGYLLVLDQGTDAFYTSYQYPFEILDSNHQIDMDILQVEKYGGYGFVTYGEWKSDTSLAMLSAGSYVYLLGTRSYQVFSYFDDVNFPFQSPNTGGAEIGCLASRSIAAVGNQIFWLGASDIGQYGVYTMIGTNMDRVSTPDIEREIASLATPSDAVAQTWQEYGHVFYAITFRAGRKTFVYDVLEKEWHIRASYNSKLESTEDAWRPQFATLAFDKLCFGTLNDNKIIYQDDNKWTEYDGEVIRRRRRGGVISAEFGPWYCDGLKLIVNSGQVNDVNLDPKVSMKYSWDGGLTWSNQWIGSIGKQGMYNWLVQWDNMGMGEELTIEISTTDNWPMGIIAAKIQGEPCCIL